LRLRRRSDGVVVPDLEGRRAGRSAWVHPSRPCVEIGARRRAFSRALAGPRGLAVREPEVGALWRSLCDAANTRLDVLRRTSGVGPTPRLSAFTALQQQLAAGEVS
jgi:hypothetical protein